MLYELVFMVLPIDELKELESLGIDALSIIRKIMLEYPELFSSTSKANKATKKATKTS